MPIAKKRSVLSSVREDDLDIRNTATEQPPNEEPYCPLYEALVEKAYRASIDISGSSESSAILHDLLRSIQNKEQLRQNLNQSLREGVSKSVDLAPDYDGVWQSIRQEPNMFLKLNLDNYFDSPNAAFYTQLLDIHAKLLHEIGAIQYCLWKAHGDLGGHSRSQSRSSSYSYSDEEAITSESEVDVIVRGVPYLKEGDDLHARRDPTPSKALVTYRGTGRPSPSPVPVEQTNPAGKPKRAVISSQRDHRYLNEDNQRVFRPRDGGELEEHLREGEGIRLRRRHTLVERRYVSDRSPSFSDSKRSESEDDEIHSSECLDWILVDMAIDRTSNNETPSKERLSGVFTVKRHMESTGHSPRFGHFDVHRALDRRPDTAFVIERQYDCEYTGTGTTNYITQPCLRHSITYLAGALKDALFPFLPASRRTTNESAWDLVLFHYRKEIIASLEDLDDHVRAQMQMLLDATEQDFHEATSLFEEGMVTPRHLPKLFSWNTVIVDNGNLVETHLCRDGPMSVKPDRASVHMEGWRWFFDGKLYLTQSLIKVQCSNKPSKIRNLKYYPLKYASPAVQDLVARRGQTFWMCRRKVFISYTAPGQIQRSQGPGNYRFMIDYDTYRELHPDAEEFEKYLYEDTVQVDEEVMDRDEPPGDGRELIFPPHITGYSIQDKKWKTLNVDFIQPISWNTLAFERLVLKPVAKELIQAVVQNNDAPERSADLMQGKGNGSLILLHGPPGTGKTLTAESVAELVHRPLYRVTCGDIGTDPEAVENYLESVLYIGKIWGCVVLLDEADVFLEERTLTDLHRNALVSVFLRVLEYYDGILILTSNRVGTFDEAFKSRIKLALHYTSLGKADRRKVWRNFFKTLKETDPEHVDFEDLDDHLDDLADVVLNGRDIRNAISVARELAKFRKDKKLDYHHLQHVIGVADDFEKYLDKTHGHKTNDWLKENGIRA